MMTNPHDPTRYTSLLADGIPTHYSPHAFPCLTTLQFKPDRTGHLGPQLRLGPRYRLSKSVVKEPRIAHSAMRDAFDSWYALDLPPHTRPLMTSLPATCTAYRRVSESGSHRGAMAVAFAGELAVAVASAAAAAAAAACSPGVGGGTPPMASERRANTVATAPPLRRASRWHAAGPGDVVRQQTKRATPFGPHRRISE